LVVVEVVVDQVDQVELVEVELEVDQDLQDQQVQLTLAVVVAVVVQVDQGQEVVQVDQVFLQLKNYVKHQEFGQCPNNLMQ
jgi:hypothetical protein